MTDVQARDKIKRAFYEEYLEHGLHVIVMAAEIASGLSLDSAQARRCFDYLTAKHLIRAMTFGGGYSPTVSLVDDVEETSRR